MQTCKTKKIRARQVAALLIHIVFVITLLGMHHPVPAQEPFTMIIASDPQVDSKHNYTKSKEFNEYHIEAMKAIGVSFNTWPAPHAGPITEPQG